MDLLSVEDKIVANTLKYMNCSTIKILRKMNKRINEIAEESGWLKTKYIQEQKLLYYQKRNDKLYVMPLKDSITSTPALEKSFPLYKRSYDCYEYSNRQNTTICKEAATSIREPYRYFVSSSKKQNLPENPGRSQKNMNEVTSKCRKIVSTLITEFVLTSDKGSITVKLRELNTDDSTEIQWIAQRAFPWRHTYCHNFVRFPTLHYTLGVIDSEDKLIGYIAIVRDVALSSYEKDRCEVEREILRGKSRSYIANLAIHEDYRRYGLASQLLRKAIEFAKQCRHELIYLHAAQNNEAAIKLYEKMGFIGEAFLQNYYNREGSYTGNGILYVMRLKDNSDTTKIPNYEETMPNEDSTKELGNSTYKELM